MRWVHIIPCAALCAMLAGCEETLVEPVPDEVGTSSLSRVIHDSWVETLDFTGLVAYVACANDGAGEDLLWSGTIDAYFWSRTTPSGNVVTNCRVDYDTDPPFSAVGLTSGDAWSLLRGEDNCNYMGKSEAPKLVVDHFQANEWYVNEDGDPKKLHLQNQLRIQRDTDGNVKMFRYVEDYKCTGKP